MFGSALVTWKVLQVTFSGSPIFSSNRREHKDTESLIVQWLNGSNAVKTLLAIWVRFLALDSQLKVDLAFYPSKVGKLPSSHRRQYVAFIIKL